MFSRVTMLRWGYKLGGLAARYTDETHGLERRRELLTLVEDIGGKRAERLVRVVRTLDGGPESIPASENGPSAHNNVNEADPEVGKNTSKKAASSRS